MHSSERPGPGDADSGAARPDVTIVIPVFNRCDLTLSCLLSLEEAQAHDSSTFELVVVDNASTDGTQDLLAGLGGDVQVIRHETNLGFGEACNAGAARARGRHVLFLNNDTVVLPGWLDPLVAALDEDPRRAAVQPRLLYPDGRLNDAGGLLFAGGDAWVYGKGDSMPHAPRYSYRRAPDYASGACLLVRRSAFEGVGGFDPRYAPAYYEDADLSMALRAAGWTVLYEPASTVVHVEGGTAGQDVTRGLKRFQVRNKARFADKWRVELAARPSMDSVDVEEWAHRGQAGWGPGEDPSTSLPDGARVLVLDQFPPMFDRAAGCLRTLEMEKAFRALGCSVVHHAVSSAPERDKYADELSRWGVQMFGTSPDSLGDPEAVATYSPSHRPDGYDLIVVGPWDVAEALLPQVREQFPSALVAVDSMDLHFVREAREGKRASPELADRRSRELAVYAAADVVLAVSQQEADVVSELVPGSSPSVVGLSVPLETRVPGPEERSGVLFVGNALHTPNLGGARWLVEEVWPLVLAAEPAAVLQIAGNDPEGQFLSLARPGVEITGWVASTQDLLRRSRVSVAPLLSGAGVKGKVAEALACGVPVVATSVAAEGMALDAGREIIVSDTAEAFASDVVRLLRDDVAWSCLSAAGRRHAGRHLGPTTMMAAVRRLVVLSASRADSTSV